MGEIDIANDIIKKHLGLNAKIVKKLNTTNNCVYIVLANDKEYILKFYKSKTWPENGKNLLVNSLLEKENIPFANVVGYSRDCDFKGGYILEERVKGEAIDMENLSLEDGQKYYSMLAKFIKKVHQIHFEKFGYLNNGNPVYSSFYDFLEDDLSDHSESLIDKELISQNDLEKIQDEFKNVFGDYSPCLCHGDLSLRNAIVNEKDLTLIDYDDTMGLPAFADIARMTFDMREYKDSGEWRTAFLNTYFKNKEEIDNFEKFEKAYHIYCAIDWIDFAIKKGHEYNNLYDYLKEMCGFINIDLCK